MTIYLVRHGKDDDSVRGGWSSHGLVADGEKQVYALANELAAADMKIEHIYSSDLNRAAQTAEILSDHLGYPVEYVSGFREINNGDLSGMKNDLANERYPGLYFSSLDFDECYPGGESPKMFYDRVKSAWSALKQRCTETSPSAALLVTHGGVIEVILCIENRIEFSNKEKHFPTPHARLIPVEI